MNRTLEAAVETDWSPPVSADDFVIACNCWLAPFGSQTPDRLDPLCPIHRPVEGEKVCV